ncbi:MAG: DUF554 domain-containing protein [Limisphaerales bacterium]
MIGTIINAACILVGGIIGIFAANSISAKTQGRIKLILAMATVFVATKMIWDGLGGGFLRSAGMIGIAALSLVIGNALGMAMRLQKGLNQLGEIAKKHMTKSDEGGNKFNEGFITCTILFCVGPMAILGAIEDGLKGDWEVLAVKGAMDGLATMGFTAMFGWGCIVAVIPVVAYQGTITLLAGALKPILTDPMTDELGVTGGFLVFTITLVILGVRKVPLANYLPALVVAPLLAKWWLN